jgi:hypothetical protein
MANKKISELPLDASVTGPDVVPIVSDGATKKVTLTTLSSFFSAAGATGPTGPGGATGPAGAAGISVTGPTGPAGAGEAYQQSSAPATASSGATWLDTDTGQIFVRYESVWVEIGGKHYP